MIAGADCPIEAGCSAWIFRYFNDCICNSRDAASFGFGLVSVISWGIAEVPQIITNFREKSTEGVSLVFLMTWVVGDFFNLAGCLLEPATLPTQFYMALLYTVTTIVLVGQTIYYSYFRKQETRPSIEEPLIPPEKQPSQPVLRPSTTRPVETPATSRLPSIISVPSPQRRKFYTSARSLASSHTPTAGSFLSNSGRHLAGYLGSQSSLTSLQVAVENEEATRPAAPELARVAATGLFLLGGFSLHSQYSVSFCAAGFRSRKLLQESEHHSQLGELCGVAMAAIYMGGRLPQIWLNMTRGTVEGLNPMMFMFALIGNATYVLSIVVRSMDWHKLKPNMPWLVDAAVCVLLDFFILAQFCYYYLAKKRKNGNNDDAERKQ